jgi:hypothetical protein
MDERDNGSSLWSLYALQCVICEEMAMIGGQALLPSKRYARFDSRMGSMVCGKNLLVCMQERYGDLDGHWS